MFFERRCPGCRRPHPSVCVACWGALNAVGPFVFPGVGHAWALFDYDAAAQPIVLAAKNGGRSDLLTLLGHQLAAGVPTAEVDLVAWVPASRRHRRRRGYDQGRLLAKATARELNTAHGRLLRRVDRNSQLGKTREQRQCGPSLEPSRAAPKSVLIVDDVMATGATMRAAIDAVRAAGATEIMVAVTAVSGRSASVPVIA